jgi:SAM-dependent methyltransferase
METVNSKADLKSLITDNLITCADTADNTLLRYEIPFSGYDEIPNNKEGGKRLELIEDNVDFNEKNVLDIGCNIGYFCFKYAQKGANCWGIDENERAIAIANSLKQIHGVENATFVHSKLNESVLDDLQAIDFDILNLLGVIHRLMWDHGSLRSVAYLLNRLYREDGDQLIIYEPSSEDLAYYPELLTKKGVKNFFAKLGVTEYRLLGSFNTDSSKKRKIWIGRRNFPALCEEIRRKSRFKTGVNQKNFRYKGFFVKENRNPHRQFLMKNEAKSARIFSKYPFALCFLDSTNIKGDVISYTRICMVNPYLTICSSTPPLYILLPADSGRLTPV